MLCKNICPNKGWYVGFLIRWSLFVWLYLLPILELVEVPAFIFLKSGEI